MLMKLNNCSMPKLSIITVNLNNAEGLYKTIESVVNQTFTDYEYIIIDGGSTDGSINVIKKYIDKITYWISEPDSGIYYAMNKGIQVANGEYIYFLNSGDYLLHYKVFELLSVHICKVDFLFVGVLKLDEISGFYFVEIPENIDKISLFKKMISHQSIFVKKQVFTQIGVFSTDFMVKADYEWLIRSIVKNIFTVAYFKTVIAFYPLGGISDKLFEEYSTKEIKKIRNMYYSPKAELFLRRFIFRPSLSIFMSFLLNNKRIRSLVLKKIS